MDWSNPIGSTVSGAFGLLGNYLQYKYNTRLAEQQNQYNLEMWKLNNEYNSPQAQMKRFEEAGLNPNLIYGQGTPGNSPSAPQMVTPEAPNLSKDMRELAQAFNIEGLRVAIANRRKANAEAKEAENAAERSSLVLGAEKAFGTKYYLDPTTGQYKERPKFAPGEAPFIDPRAYYINKILEDNFRTNSLLVPRAALIGSQRLYNIERQKLLAPQVGMMNYSAKYFPYTFWLGNARTGAQVVSPLIP